MRAVRAEHSMTKHIFVTGGVVSSLGKGLTAASGIDAVNATLQGPLSLTSTREDLGPDGAAVIRQNTVNRA